MKKTLLVLGLSLLGFAGFSQRTGANGKPAPLAIPYSPPISIKFSDSSINILYGQLTSIEKILDESSIDHKNVKFCFQILENLKAELSLQYKQEMEKRISDSTKTKSKK